MIDPTLEEASGTSSSASSVDVEIGILTKGKATLGMVLTSLLLQDAVTVRIHVVDTSNRPVITRDDVRFALRLAGDRGIRCSYEFAGESKRAFSDGRARIIRELAGHNLCLCDDDVVIPSVALSQLVATARKSGEFGYICPILINAPKVAGDWEPRPPCTPGSLIYQDALVRRILLEYYDSTIDVLDQDSSEEKVWETAFLTDLFDSLNRPAIRQQRTINYHLDYQEGASWIKEERTVIARSRNVARQLVQRHRNSPSDAESTPIRAISPIMSRLRSPSWWARARRLLRLPL